MIDSNTLPHHEEALTYSVEGETVVGIVHHGSIKQTIGVLLVVGGRQYRVGAHRQFVSLARYLSRRGYSVFRFDLRGMGDSCASPLHFLESAPDIAAAIKTFRHMAPQVDRIMLWGLCDGASASLLFAADNAGIDSVMMVNPWVTTDGGLARTQLKHYYQKRLISASFWKKLVSGGVNWIHSASSLGTVFRRSLSGSRRNPDSALSLPDKVFKAMEVFDGYVSIIISEKDLTAREFRDEYQKRNGMRDDVVSRWCLTSVEADHTFSTHSLQTLLEELTEQWLVDQ